jgi:putative transposase
MCTVAASQLLQLKGEMEAADIKKIRDLEDENRCLKRMFVDLSLECRALKDVIEKSFKPEIKRELVNCLTMQFTMSTRPACRTLFCYQPNT